jgi:hypothetical protein
MVALAEVERCATCAVEVGESRCFCRFYQADGVFVFCCPDCAETFLRGPKHRVDGTPRGALMHEMIEELRWTSFG